MKITFVGAAQTVTGSCFLVETQKTSFLVDCGLHQGSVTETALNRQPFPFEIEKIDFMLLTHAHIDHSGRIPKLFVDGFDKDIYTTKATADLCKIMLPDSGHIQEIEQEWKNRKGGRAGKEETLPLYTMQNGIDACRLFHDVLYDQEFHPAEDIRVVMRDAGHILGSAILEIWVKEPNKKGSEETKIVFSGDLGNKGIPIMRDPTIISGADYLVIESTYGDRLHEANSGKGEKVDRLVSIINETIDKGGNVVIPSFAVGRTQEIIYELNKEEYDEKMRDRFLKIPVYVDSPMATSATKAFMENEDCYDDEAKEFIRSGDNPLDFPNLHFTASADESKALNLDEESKIIISASGMCDAGRIKHHLKHNLWKPNSTIIFVGYQAQGTLGRKLVDGAKSVRIFNEEIVVRARIEVIEGFSGHADRNGLIDWIRSMKDKPREIFLVHGEPEVIAKFSETILEVLHIPTHIGKLDESIVVGDDLPRESVVTGARTAVIPSASLEQVCPVLDEMEETIHSLTETCRKQLAEESSIDKRNILLLKYKKMLEEAESRLFTKIQ